ncbi:hypothetical protein N7492_000229 [Penicillium capsulatum]|uniref:Uncharacterized protein n=1 Tax=Penicillium capsulatum TaxID=69766 RepID=A0A9W9IQV0_9EURO|nr:hypothetical protein N7492_000229 [Penicillium capsulatum]KAJ6130705.1 hypothetical protein N7512_003485 [Penicillium capsulatum]
MGNYTVVNGQIYTPGLAIVDAPQPYTPLGGGKNRSIGPVKGHSSCCLADLQVAIDVSGNGQLPWPAPAPSADAPTRFHNITLYLTSRTQSRNLTISNGTIPPDNTKAYVGPVLDLEPSSTVKHVNWKWPKCLVGEGTDGESSARGAYNISMHQSFRWNDTDYYTVFELPIAATNHIAEDSERVDCDLLENALVDAMEIDQSSDVLPDQPWIHSGVQTGAAPSLLVMR